MCEVNENELIQEEIEDKTIEEMSQEELVEVVYQLMDMKEKEIEVNMDDVQGLSINVQEYQAGIDSISFLVGQYSALKRVGIDSTSAIDVILNERNIEYNLELNKMTCDNNREVAKIQQTNQEQNQV